jgi:uncharacterized DUF497 family protein
MSADRPGRFRPGFEWDERKAAENLRKHGVSFEEAASVFWTDDFSVELYDPEHSDDEEERFITIGFSENAAPLLVVHCERSDRVSRAELVRILSARRADATAKRRYREEQRRRKR